MKTEITASRKKIRMTREKSIDSVSISRYSVYMDVIVTSPEPTAREGHRQRSTP